MDRALQVVRLLLALTASVAVGAIGWYGAFALQQAATAATAATAAEKQASADEARVTDELLRPCKGPAGDDACGTLATIKKAANKAGDAIVTTQRAELTTVPHVTEAMDAFKGAADKLAGTAQDASLTLQTAGTTIAGLQPLSAQMVKNGEALQTATEALTARINDDRITRLVAHLESITDSGAGIMADGKKVSDAATAAYLKPVRWYAQPFKKSGELIDIGAAVARHTP